MASRVPISVTIAFDTLRASCLGSTEVNRQEGSNCFISAVKQPVPQSPVSGLGLKSLVFI
tara:strand:- start:494 stop:673 length:180 start_codon:yes stop_codon:yes gene_type:complete